MATIKIRYIGHASFCFESELGTTIYYDPWLDESPVACMKRDEVAKADIIIFSHGHNDHVRDAFEICHRLKPFLLTTMRCVRLHKLTG